METFLNEDYLDTEEIIHIGNKTDDLDLRVLCATVLVLRATGAKCMIMSRQRPLWESQELWTPWTITTEGSVYDRIKHGLTTKHADWRTEITIYQEASPNVVSINKDKAEEILSSLSDTPPVNPLVAELNYILNPHNLLDKTSQRTKKKRTPIDPFEILPTLSLKTVNGEEILQVDEGKHK